MGHWVGQRVYSNRHVRKTSIRGVAAVADQIRCENIVSAFLRGLPSAPIIDAHTRTMVIAAYGPSLRHSVEEIRKDPGDLFTVSGAHDFLIKHGIVPRGHIESDPRSHKAKLLLQPSRDVSYFLASVCSREMYDRVSGYPTFMWHVESSEAEANEVKRQDRRAYIVNGGTNVAMGAIGLGTALGYRRFSIYGMDCSFEASDELLAWPKDTDIPEDVFKTVRCHADSHPNETQTAYRVWVDKRPFISSAEMFQGAQDFVALRASKPQWRFTLHGDGFLKNLIDFIDAKAHHADPQRAPESRQALPG